VGEKILDDVFDRIKLDLDEPDQSDPNTVIKQIYDNVKSRVQWEIK